MPRVELRDYRKARTPFGSLLRLFRYFRHCRTIMICAVASILVYVAATIAASYCMKPLVNLLKQTGLAPSEVYAKYLALLLGLAGLYALSAVTNYLLNRLMLECSTVIMRALRTELFAKMQRLPISYFDANTNGSLMSYFTNDIEATNELLQHAITQMLISVTSLLGTIGMMLALSMKLFSLMVVLAAIVIVVVRGITKKSSRCYRQQQKDAASVNGFVEEMIAGQRDVKVFTHEKQVMQDFEPINESFYQSSAEATTVTSIVGPILNNLSHFFYALTCAVGVLWLTGENAGGVLITFLGYIRTFAERVSQISEQFNAIMLALAGAERIFDVLDMPPEVDEGEVTLEQSGRDYFWVRPDGERVPLRGDVRFYGVDFAYVPEKPVLRDLSLYAKPGQKIAFVGSTGAGKTTITNLINRFYDIQGGQITYDGIDVRHIRKDDLRRSLGTVLQDTHLFTGTVMENIRYGRLEATDEDCIRAAKIANAHYFISHLPQGYDTMLTSDGANLSQGQRQLLAIARAAVSEAPVLILDEATSSVDTRTEKLIERGLDGLMKGRTVFVIAHRLSTVRNADAILVLENGRVVERGNHNDLLELRGRYYQLYTNMIELA
ncbi:MAG: ABC transporter ATP-binding protein [Firmicutes bacterium]|mgnify:FL=1|jgi:ATP-binding cassette subfamily B multidrug efflux pump|nr:ABC transporter ATP-binding protein [Oscillospiraceae bacterium]MDD6247217.1 ABC transporter ATP-binding protein [Bacillota bacterium]MDY2808909.1 ABC transporter ATP-binding protein [Oscillospiraceae bacterium]CDB88415.1 aBC-type multidrug transport system [Firmicutes bacterium CAG:170]